MSFYKIIRTKKITESCFVKAKDLTEAQQLLESKNVDSSIWFREYINTDFDVKYGDNLNELEIRLNDNVVIKSKFKDDEVEILTVKDLLNI